MADSDNSSSDDAPDKQAAVGLIRQKVAQLYSTEPDVIEEMAEADSAERRSPHQQFMHDLAESGKDLAAIQTEWHNYYQNLSDRDKFKVWQEFYDSQSRLQQIRGQGAEPSHSAPAPAHRPSRRRIDNRTSRQIRSSLKDKISAGGKLSMRHHIQSLLFGLGIGLVVVVIFLFGFFNEVVIAPLIQPSRASAQTPLIIGSNTPPPSPNPEVIIPKINVEIPVDYSESSTDESVIENDLNSGVVHYPTTVLPGQTGNTAFFGHSSNNIFNPGKYKFAFVLLHTLVPSDTFYLTYHSKLYVYKVISRSIVDPSDVSVLGPVAGQTATATLITCDPPGTSLHRLIVVGQQVSPDPASDSAGAPPPINHTTTRLPGNGPTLWTRFIDSFIGKLIFVLVVGAVIFYLTAPLRRHILRAA